MKVTQSCLTLCDPMAIHTVHGIFQARILEWVTFPPPGDLLNPGIKPRSPTLQADSLPAEPPGKPNRAKETFKEIMVEALPKLVSDTIKEICDGQRLSNRKIQNK